MPKTGLQTNELRNKATGVALGLVRKHGYEKLRLLDVARELHVSHAALYKYFASKDELLDSINSQWLEQIDSALEEICSSSDPVLARIKRWATLLYTMKREKVLSDLEPYSAFLDATAQDRSYIQAHLRVVDEQLSSMVELAIKEKLISGDARSITGLLLSAMKDFHHPAHIAERLHEDRTAELQYLLDTIFAGLKP